MKREPGIFIAFCPYCDEFAVEELDAEYIYHCWNCGADFDDLEPNSDPIEPDADDFYSDEDE